MKKIFKLHWEFLSKPTYCLEEYIPNWSLKSGIYLYIFFLLYSYFQDPKLLSIYQDHLVAVFGIGDLSFLYFFIFLNFLYIVLVHYHIYPPIIRIIPKIPKEEYSADLYRKLVFYSPISFVIYSVIILIPLQLLSSVLLMGGGLNTLILILMGITSLLGLWSLVLIVNIFVIQWKGLSKYFKLSAGKIILAEFIVPVIFMIPLIIFFGSKYLNFLSRYIK